MSPSNSNTKQKILKSTVSLFAQAGYEGISMRKIAKEAKIASSVLYYYFTDKDILLKYMFDTINSELGVSRSDLPKQKTASEMLKQRIRFQLEHAEQIVAVLKYYLTYRKQFQKNPTGYVPQKAYLHIEEALHFGVTTGEFLNDEIEEQAKVITHAINGFILEYYPDVPHSDEQEKLVNTIHSFIIRAIKK